MGLTKLKQQLRFQFTICINTFNGVLVDNNDLLHVVWKTASHKGKLKTHTLKLENSLSQTHIINLWWQQQIIFEESLCLDVDDQSFDTDPLSFFLKREKVDMVETLAEFKTDLGLCVNTVLSENVFSVDVPSRTFGNVKANITVRFKLLDKSAIREMETPLYEAVGLTSSILELKEEMARVSNEYLVLKTLVIDSQSFSKADFWVEKLPDMELNLRQTTSKLDELNTHFHKVLHDTKITVLDDKITDMQTKLFSEQDKLRRLSDIYHTFTQSTILEMAKLRDKVDKPTISPDVGEIMGGVTPRALGKHLSLHLVTKHKMLSPPASPRTLDSLELSTTDVSPKTSPDNTPNASPALASINPMMDAEIRAKFRELDEYRIRLERIESDTQQLWPRLALDEADAQQIHLTTEALKWEREKDMENFYLFQKSQSQFAEELSKLKLQINDFHTVPRKLEQRVELLEVQMAKVKRSVAGMRFSGGGEDGRSISSPTLAGDWRLKQQPEKLPPPRSPNMKAQVQQASYSARGNASWTPPYHWFLLDHCFLFASDGEPAGDLLVPAYFLIKFCTTSLDLANCKEDWSVFDGLFFSLHFEVKKHHKSPTHLLFWLANASFILEQLNLTVFSTFKSRDLTPGLIENAQTVIKELENFIKTIYVYLAGFISQVFDTAVKSFSFCSTEDSENEWVTSILAKLDWLNTLLRSYKLKDSFIQHVFGDMYAVMDSTLFNLVCSDSSLCTPARANQMKYFISALDKWACSDHPTNSRILDRLCHIREAANLILGPKGNLRESSFRKSLFPHITDLQQKHILTIFTSDSRAEKLPPTLLSHLSSQITYTPGHEDLDNHAIYTSHELGTFFDSQPNPSDSGPTGRFSPPPVTDTSSQAGYALVDSTMRDIEDILTCDAYVHWGYLSRELQKWCKPAVTLDHATAVPLDEISTIAQHRSGGRKGSIHGDTRFLIDFRIPRN